ncbi:MAG: DUF3592 domain-containing protein [Actinobacteria bacterium]|nr:DUF3592 domain-containing protein [Actinomycetota bacterium]
MPVWLVIGLVALFGCGLLCVVNLARLLAGARRRRGGATTTGRVLQVELGYESAGEGMATTRTPLVEFADGSGNNRRFRNSEPVDACPEPGGTLPVWFDPADPAGSAEVVPGPLTGRVVTNLFGIALSVGIGLFLYWFAARWAG